MTHILVRIDGEYKTIIAIGSKSQMESDLKVVRENWPNRIYAIEEVKAANTGE